MGITKDEYLSLIKLNKKDFVYREWIALNYAREWAYIKGGIVPEIHNEEFIRQYSKKEQEMIKKLLRTMLFANYCGNSYYKRPWKKNAPAMACEIDFNTNSTILNDEK